MMWAVSRRFDWGEGLLGVYCYTIGEPPPWYAVRTALFRTRADAYRHKQATDGVRRVRVTIEVMA